MLETIKTFIQALPNKNFEQFFDEYVMSVQDRGISDEVEYTLKKMHNDIVDIERIIQSEYGGLVNKQ